MTRETKIGLLVGLAFIIVIGILLSDQLMRSTEPPAAPLASVADTLRKGTVTPAPARQPVAQVQAPQDVSPDTAVPTKDDITRRPPPVTFVEVRPGASAPAPNGDVVIGPGNGGAASRDPAGPGQIAIAPAGGAGRAIGLVGADGAPVAQRGQSNMVPIRTQSPDATPGRSLADVAAAMGETLVGPDGQPIRSSRQNPAQQKQQNTERQQNATAAKPRPAGAAVGVKLYTAEPGDSLSRIAARHMGANTKANRDAIVRANPSLADDPNKIIVGQSYNIPLAAGQSAQAQSAAPAQRVERTERAAAPIKASGGEYWYEVKPGDNLWKIAKTQLGASSTVHAIKELNKESVKNWDVLPAGTRIKLPARPLASVQ